MKLAQRFLFLAALVALPGVNVLQALPPVGATPPKAKTAAPNKATETPEQKEKRLADEKEVHNVAAIVFSIAGDEREVMFELLSKGAPATVENFTKNVKEGVYKGQAVHRTINDYLVQTGDPASKDKSARETWGTSQEYTIPGEFKLPHVLGAVAMARRSDKVNPTRASDGTQFYFVLGDMSALNGSYTVFGQVITGMDVLKKISHTVADSNDCPLARIEIKEIKVFEQKGPLIALTTPTGRNRHATRPEALKGPIEKLIERVW